MNEMEQRLVAGAHLISALAEVRRLQQQVIRLEQPQLLGYADVAHRALEHLARALDYPPCPRDLAAEPEPPSS